MQEKPYMVVIKEGFIRDMQVFASSDFLTGKCAELNIEEIRDSIDHDCYWKDWKGIVFLCQIFAKEVEVQKKLSELAEKYQVPVMILEAVPIIQRSKTEYNESHDPVCGKDSRRGKLIEELGSVGYMQRFYEFLQGKFHPDNITKRDVPELSPEQAWHSIYCMQEYFGIFDDRFERCRECGDIYDSYEEGTVIDEDTEPIEIVDMLGQKQIHNFAESEYGTYCEECRPD